MRWVTVLAIAGLLVGTGAAYADTASAGTLANFSGVSWGTVTVPDPANDDVDGGSGQDGRDIYEGLWWVRTGSYDYFRMDLKGAPHDTEYDWAVVYGVYMDGISGIDAHVRALRPALDAGVWLLKPNARELGELIGRTVEGQQEIEEVSRQFVDQGKAEIVVTSLGAGGSVVVTADICTRVPAPPVRVESKVGAGDSMVAGLVLALDRGESLLDAVRYGTAAGAAAVMDAETGLGSREHVERLYEQLKREAQ